jgi:hypothetical protein
MGPNEPNNIHNCNRTPATIAQAWGDVMRLWPSSQLVSPATAGDGRPWLTQFFGNCSKLYGAGGCNISHVAVHDYSCTAAETMAYLSSIHDLFQLPVWLTEFSCGDGAQNKSMAKHLAYMKEIVPLLDAAPFVYRYAWMSASSANRGLIATAADGTQSLTPVGALYKSL